MYKRIKRLTSVNKVKNALPASDLAADKAKFDDEIKNIINRNGKFLLIIGPCSADNPSAVIKYCEFLKQISEHVHNKIFIVPRIYTTKPRSEAGAYRGILHSPDCKSDSVDSGIYAARKLMLDVARNFGFFSADEMLYPELLTYFDDLLSYITLGARSSEDQLHRMCASGLDVAVGIKNPMHGSLISLARAIKTINSPNNFAFNGYEVISSGNKYAHAILRGYTDNRGNMKKNYTDEYLDEIALECDKLNINPAVIIDCNHFNSGKNYMMEPEIALEAIDIAKRRNDGIIKGLMIESYLLDGKQNLPLEFGKSLTDECLGLSKTEKLIFEIADKL